MLYKDFPIGDRNFRIYKLSGFKQLHLSRRIVKFLPAMIPTIVAARESNTNVWEAMINLAGDALHMFCDLPDAEVEYIFSIALSAVNLKQGDLSSPVWNTTDNVPMFEFLDLPLMLQLTYQVVEFNLGGFIKGHFEKALSEMPVMNATSQTTK